MKIAKRTLNAGASTMDVLVAGLVAAAVAATTASLITIHKSNSAAVKGGSINRLAVSYPKNKAKYIVELRGAQPVSMHAQELQDYLNGKQGGNGPNIPNWHSELIVVTESSLDPDADGNDGVQVVPKRRPKEANVPNNLPDVPNVIVLPATASGFRSPDNLHVTERIAVFNAQDLDTLLANFEAN